MTIDHRKHRNVFVIEIYLVLLAVINPNLSTNKAFFLFFIVVGFE